MNLWELMLLALVLWTLIGTLGTLLSLVRRERAKARNGVAWLVAVWVVYMAVELVAAKTQGQRTVAIGEEQCFDEMCFAVTGMEEIPGFFGRDTEGRDRKGDGSRVLRVSIRIKNKGRGRSQSERLIKSYLLDGEGRDWKEMPGLTGVPLTTMVAAGATVVSEPVYKVASDATGLSLVFTHGRWQPGVLVIGDSDSLGHQATVVRLEQ